MEQGWVAPGWGAGTPTPRLLCLQVSPGVQVWLRNLHLREAMARSATTISRRHLLSGQVTQHCLHHSLVPPSPEGPSAGSAEGHPAGEQMSSHGQPQGSPPAMTWQPITLCRPCFMITPG